MERDDVCPICGQQPAEVVRSREDIESELAARDRFFAERLKPRAARRPLRDVTDNTLGVAAAILRCERCGVLVRQGAPGEGVFSGDHYDDSELALLHQNHAEGFRAKADDYRSLLPSSARVVEVGSYAGGFLTAAAEWGWSAVGTDIDEDVVRYCRSIGLDARRMHFEGCAFEASSLDAVFVWNCFEQLPNGAAVLTEAARVLRDGGLLVLRVPDAGLYLRETEPVLAYNGILGWPHRFGFTVESLRRFAERYAFSFRAALRRPVIRPLEQSLVDWALAEEAALLTPDRCGWIELSFTLASTRVVS